MAFPRPGAPSFKHEKSFLDPDFDMFDWHPHFLSCARFFLDHAQFEGPVQNLAAFLNIQLPFQKAATAVYHAALVSSSLSVHGEPPSGGSGGMGAPAGGSTYPPSSVTTLAPYVRRLVATGFDFPAVMHSFFGDDWRAGVGPLHQQERRNYLFAAKSDNWLRVKTSYDMGESETIPFIRPLQGVSEEEISSAEAAWSEWLAMQDWMLGPRAPEAEGGDASGGASNRRSNGTAGLGRMGNGKAYGGGGRVNIKKEEN
ncbi:hypothetical protein B0T26DRAFT_738544 [Lasiosphaeria miniovina]|uniref:Ilp is an apoptosis inhibitor n=1 Tax=Lasiosphaeria miniovina TaxID=1954250 RepID=A0AA40B5V5_9PEZI|nr:uncharacterized protein B0T26DRAFT_738544 [Lasiosphaeria miniovina]KAK0728072.1 hypothetical protein B0T26DRAFT_738544 [Lasiosphaeria miniovina]